MRQSRIISNNKETSSPIFSQPQQRATNHCQWIYFWFWIMFQYACLDHWQRAFRCSFAHFSHFISNIHQASSMYSNFLRSFLVLWRMESALPLCKKLAITSKGNYKIPIDSLSSQGLRWFFELFIMTISIYCRSYWLRAFYPCFNLQSWWIMHQSNRIVNCLWNFKI